MKKTPLISAHLPTGKVVDMLCGKLPQSIKNSLLLHVDSLIELNKAKNVEPSLYYHADISACVLSDSKIIISPEQIHLKEKLISLGFYVIISEKNPKSPYPNDCLLNYVDLNGILIFNNNIHGNVIYRSYDKSINVNQGYVKCSVAPVAENAIITDDSGIANMASQQGIDVCFVRKGDVRLPGYEYGFIGGCCGKISKDELAFCGNISKHRDFDQISEFLFKYNIKAVSLTDDELLDVGSLIPLTQEKG